MAYGDPNWELLCRDERGDPIEFAGRQYDDACEDPACGHALTAHRRDTRVCSICQVIREIRNANGAAS